LLHASSPAYSPPLPETLAPLLKSILTTQEGRYTHFFSAHSSAAKSLLPRVAAALDLPAVSDIISISHDEPSDTTTFTRPIYAGNAIATICANADIKLKVVTVRGTAFTPLSGQAEHEATVEEVAPVELSDAEKVTEHLKTEVSKSDRPDLGIAKRVVSGGRALKNKVTFNATLEPLAGVLGAAVGASRAAVDAGYADNSLQVGQTGKIVAPELYIAIGISGAIQHLAGMKDSKMIVAINKVCAVTCMGMEC
jgi:electron transfer flavoprotein alpha subunit